MILFVFRQKRLHSSYSFQCSSQEEHFLVQFLQYKKLTCSGVFGKSLHLPTYLKWLVFVDKSCLKRIKATYALDISSTHTYSTIYYALM